MSTFGAILTVIVGVGLSIQVRRHGKPMALIALQLLLVFVGSWALWQLDQNDDDLHDQQVALEDTQKRLATTQRKLKRERSIRSKVQAEINRYVCTENNKQDRLLARILAISLSDTDEEKLTEDERKALAVFIATLRDLQDEAPCNEIVIAFIEASDTDDLEAIRKVLRETKRPPQLQPKPKGGRFEP